MHRVKVTIAKDILDKTLHMNDYERIHYLIEMKQITSSHIYGYGIYGGARIVDDTHVEYNIGDSCD